jgi:short-subunit dehydrogenase
MRDEIVLITGGSSGIGLSAAQHFAARGARLWLVARDRDKLTHARATLGPTARVFVADVTRPEDLTRLADAVRAEVGRIDVLVNSAGQLDLGDASASAADLAERLMRSTTSDSFGPSPRCCLSCGSERAAPS